LIDSLFPGYDEFMEAKAGESALAYEVRWLKKLYKALSIEDQFAADQREAGEEFGLHWYNECHDLPIKLYASRLKNVAPADILRSQGMTKREFWREYFDHKANHPKGALVGLIFPVNAMQHFIMHNMLGLEAVSGMNRVMRYATNPDHCLIVEPVEAFLTALSRAPLASS